MFSAEEPSSKATREAVHKAFFTAISSASETLDEAEKENAHSHKSQAESQTVSQAEHHCNL
jgi:hypothetical protein